MLNDMQPHWIAAAACGAIAIAASLAERRRARRARIDRVGWVPWPGVMLTALFAGAICVAFGMRA